jgi:hypothetical protein
MPFMYLIQHLRIRARPRLFDQVGHETMYASTLESDIDVGQGITVGPGKFVKKNKHRALNNRRA